jgi:hypothetical protein
MWLRTWNEINKEKREVNLSKKERRKKKRTEHERWEVFRGIIFDFNLAIHLGDQKL